MNEEYRIIIDNYIRSLQNYDSDDNGITMDIPSEYLDNVAESFEEKLKKKLSPTEAFDELRTEIYLFTKETYFEYIIDDIKQELKKANLDEEFYDIEHYLSCKYEFYIYDDEIGNSMIDAVIYLDDEWAKILKPTYDINFKSETPNVSLYNGENTLLWLAQQQGRYEELKRCIETGMQSKFRFVNSCVEELKECTDYCYMLAFCFSMSINDFAKASEIADGDDNNKKGKSITISSDSLCGLYSPWSGAGSSMEVELDGDVKIPFEIIKDICTQEHSWIGCSIRETYCQKLWNDGKCKAIA